MQRKCSYLGLSIGLFLFGAVWAGGASAQCSVPNTLTNGQVADASKVMENLKAVSGCADASVKPTGTPVIGAITVVSGAKSITSGNLSGDVTTSGSTVTTLAPSGVIAGTYNNANITVDAKGRVTAASQGGGSGGSGGSTAWNVIYKWSQSANGDLPAQTINVNVSSYNDVIIVYDRVTKSESKPVMVQFSVDGGLSFDGGVNYLSDLSGSGNVGNYDDAIYSYGWSSGPSTFTWNISALRNSGPKPYFGNRPGLYVNYAPITNIGLFILSSYNGGAITVLAR